MQPIGLTLYNLRPRRDAQANGNWQERPPGQLIWLHAPAAVVARGLLELAARLIEEDGLPVLLTCPDPLPPRPGLILQPPPEDQPAQAQAFLDHWQPSAAVFSDGELRTVLLHLAQQRGLPMVLADARTPAFPKGRDGWYPGLTRASLAGFRHIFALDEVAARSFRKAGAPNAIVEITGRLEEDSAALPYLEAERAALALLLATRPVWLAAGLPEAEEATIIAAHQDALGHSHRLLLIIVPEDADRAPQLAQRLADAGLITASRAEEEEPEPDVEVFITDGQAEMGLWYRLAPITFLGGSLGGSGCLRNPMEPAALGSAILYGTRPGPYGTIFGRLGAARAARAIGSAHDLRDALTDLLSPDKTARLAQAAWIVATDGAEVTERLVDILRQHTEG